MSMTRKEWYILILSEIEKKFNKGSSANWTSKYFEALSEEIYLKTNVLISTSTLKRIFGKVSTNEEYYPQQSTLNALKEFSGVTIKEPKSEFYFSQIHQQLEENDLNAEVQLPQSEKQSVPIAETKNTSKPKIKLKGKTWVYGLCFVTLLLFAYGFVKFIWPSAQLTDPKFHVIKLDGKNSFMTARYGFDISKIKDSVFFKDGTRYGKLVYVEPTSDNMAFFYNKPGNYFASLRTRKNILADSICILVRTNGWESAIGYLYQTDRNYYVDLQKATQNGYFHIDKKLMPAYGVDTNKHVLCYLENFKQTNQNGDSFLFETDIKNTVRWNSLRCNAFEFAIAGDNGNIKFEIVNEGCSTYSQAILSENYMDGFKHDLSQLTNNFSEFKNIKVINTNKNVSLKIDNNEVFKGTYENSIGNLVGISIVFHGSGFVKTISLKKDESSPEIFKY